MSWFGEGSVKKRDVKKKKNEKEREKKARCFFVDG